MFAFMTCDAMLDPTVQLVILPVAALFVAALLGGRRPAPRTAAGGPGATWE